MILHNVLNFDRSSNSEVTLTTTDLIELLRQTEGFGRQHVFLFKTEPEIAQKILNADHLAMLLLDTWSLQINGAPKLVDKPESPTFVDATTGKKNGLNFLFIKEIEKRTSRKFLSEVTNTDQMTYTRIYSVQEQRAINSIRLWENGLLEVRLSSKDNGTKYRDELLSFSRRLRPLIDVGGFHEVSLNKLKDSLWSKRNELKDTIRFSTYTLANDEGITLRANTAFSTDDLSESKEAAESLEVFKDADAICTESNIFFKIPKPEETHKEVHVLLNGENHEFAITSALTEEEYEYVFQQIRKHY